MRDEEMLAEIEDFLEGFNQPTYRGMRINRVVVATSGIAGAGYFANRTAPNSRRPVHPGGQVARGSPLEQNQ